MGEGERRARSGGGLPSEKAQGAREGGLSPSPQAEGADLLFWHRPREAVLGQGRRGPASLLPERATGRTQPWRQEPRRRPRGSPGGVPAEHAPPPPPPLAPPPLPPAPSSLWTGGEEAWTNPETREGTRALGFTGPGRTSRRSGARGGGRRRGARRGATPGHLRGPQWPPARARAG